MKTKEEILEHFKNLASTKTNGLEKIFGKTGKDEVFQRLRDINNNPISEVQLNQLFTISGLPGFKFDFFNYYWLKSPKEHPYEVDRLEDYEKRFINSTQIISLNHLRWGLTRIYIDGLLYFGNITRGYNVLSKLTESEIFQFFQNKRFPTSQIMKRGETLEFENIPKEDRYLISEMACKTYEAESSSENDLKQYLIDNYNLAIKEGLKQPKIKDLFDGKYTEKVKKYEQTHGQLLFAAEDILEESIKSTADIEEKYEIIAKKFTAARAKALTNTKYYLSLVNDLDVYVATSMRTKDDFVKMANNCEKMFKNDTIRNLHLRYFDPTISAADRHEDKGMIECLMVRCAKALIYSAGFKESYGKDAEAAMALSTGKPVIFFCQDISKANFYKKVHPLTKLIDFSTGVANGAIVAFNTEEVIEILRRIFENQMEYTLEQPEDGFFKLVEKKTESVVRIQTNNELLSNSFWNYYERIAK